MPHTDHATWVSFTTEQLTELRWLLGEAPTQIYGAGDACTKMLDVLDHYESDETKDQQFRAAAEDINWVRDGECEVDDHAVVSASDDGAYVMAWVWVDRIAIEPDYVPTYLRNEG